MSFDLSETISENQIKLNILSRLKPGSRLVTEGQSLSIEGESRGYSLLPRWFRGESRNRALIRVQQIVAQSLELSNALLYRLSIEAKDVRAHQQLCDYERQYEAALKGLTAWQETYVEDSPFQSHVEHMISKITNQVRLLQSRLQSRRQTLE